MSSNPSPVRLPALSRLLAHPRFVWVVVGVAVLLGLASLGNGLIADDLAHRALISAHHAGRGETSWWDLFVLVEHDPQRTAGLRTSGRYPWWVDPQLRIAFFRPLSALTHHLDYLLWPDSPRLMHAHSLLWHAACCAIAWAVARRLVSSPRVAGLAALLYALSFTHVIPWGWLAHRNGLVSSFWALAAVLAHLRWRQDGDRAAAVLAPLCLALALLGAEAGVVALAFVIAYELVVAHDGVGQRVAALLPALITISCWRVVYGLMGYGAVGSGGYIDPISDPMSFAAALPARFGSLLALSVSPPYLQQAPFIPWVVATAAVGVALLVFVVSRSSRAGAARGGLLATAIGCLPLAASFPVERVLVLVSFGVSLALAELLDSWLIQRAGRAPTAAGLVVVVVHVLAPVVADVYISSHLEQVVAGQTDAYGLELDDDRLRRQGLVILHTPHYPAADQLTLNRAARGLATPNFVWVLHTGPEQPTARCIDARTIELRAPELGWPAGGFGVQFRSVSEQPFAVGDTVRTLDFSATITSIEGGRATAVAFEFRAPLNHPSFAWADWSGEEFVPIDPRQRCETR